jgi:hypothetical protein
MTNTEIAEARSYLSDRTWADDVDIDELTDTQVVAGLERHYAGGIAQFIADGA